MNQKQNAALEDFLILILCAVSSSTHMLIHSYAKVLFCEPF